MILRLKIPHPVIFRLENNNSILRNPSTFRRNYAATRILLFLRMISCLWSPVQAKLSIFDRLLLSTRNNLIMRFIFEAYCNFERGEIDTV